MFDNEKTTTINNDELSLESIIAEYSDFDPEKAAGRDTAERSRQIVYEALGETEFSGGVESASPEAEATVEAYHDELYPEPPEFAPPEPERRRGAGRYSRRLRRGFERFGRPRRPEPEPYPDEGADYAAADAGAGWEDAYGAGYVPEPAGEPEFAGDDDVKVYRPKGAFVPPEGDEDVKLYGGLDSVVAEAEERSARWSSGSAYAGGETFSGYGGGYEGPGNETRRFTAFEDGVDDYGYESGEGEGYAAPGSEDAPRDYGQAPKAGPLLGLLASLGLRFRRAQEAGEAAAVEDEEELSRELPPKKAAKYYAGSVNSLRIRTRLALFPLATILWVSLGLPAFGALGTGLKVTSLACLVMQLCIVMLGLDVFTAGIMSLVRGRPGMWSLAAVANIAAALDAAVAYGVGTAGWGYPMCAAAALAMFFALWGALLEARALRFSSKALELAEDPMIVTAEGGVDGREGTVLLKSRRPAAGWLRRCEEPDAAENAFSAAAPWLLLAALVLSLIAAAVSRRWTYFFRIFAAVCCAAAPAGSFIACPLPYFLLALRSYRMGAAVAGWPGMRDIGKSLGMVITDSDLFPGDSVKISSIRILDGSSPEEIIADAGSLIIASGSGLSPVFTELMRRNGCAMRRVEDFCCHEGGGLTALIAGEEVLCGSAGFMRLMGVLVPQKLADKRSVFVSVNGVLCGIFNIEYSPVKSVGRALAGCLKSRRAPLFAVRDFLVTPMLLHKKYGVPAESFDFPLFSVRYAVSSTEPEEGSPVCALLGREGLGGFMEAAGCGRRCYLSAVLGTALSAIGSAVGLIAAFALYVSGGALTAAWLLALYALFALPGIIASLAGARL